MKWCSDDNWDIELNIEIVSITYFYYIFYFIGYCISYKNKVYKFRKMNLVFYSSIFKRLHHMRS